MICATVQINKALSKYDNAKNLNHYLIAEHRVYF